MEKLIRALRCSATGHGGDLRCHEDCPYRVLEEIIHDFPVNEDINIDGVAYWVRCDRGRMALDAAEALEKNQRFQWIPVSERSPDDYGAVLLQYSNRRWLETEQREALGIGYFDAFGNAEHRTEDCEKFRGEVVAWMPLPEPYKGVENDIRLEEKIRK